MSELPRGPKNEVPQPRLTGVTSDVERPQQRLATCASEIDKAEAGSQAHGKLYQQALSVFEAHLDSLDHVDCQRNFVYFASRIARLPPAMRLDSYERLCRIFNAEAPKIPEEFWSDTRVEMARALSCMPPESASAAASAYVHLLPSNAGKLQRFFTPFRHAASSPDILQTRAGIIPLLDEIPKEASVSARRQLVGFSLRRWPQLFCDVEIVQAFINNVIASLPQGEDGEALVLQIETLQKGLQGKLALATPMTQQSLARILVPLLRACMEIDAESRSIPLKAVLGLLDLAEGKGWVLTNAYRDLMECILSLPEGEIKTELLACMVQITA